MDTQGRSTVALLHNLMEAYEYVCQPVCKEVGLTQTSLNIMVFLANNPEYNRARDVSRFLGIKPSLISFHVEKLVGEGYLQRQTIPGNRRSIKLVITEKARPLVEKGCGIMDDFCDMVTRGMSEEERCQLRSHLAIIGENVMMLREGKIDNV